EKRHPSRWNVDQATLLHPVKLTHRSGHAHVLNSLALKLLNISSETPDPPGGLIDRDCQTGEPTGLLYAMGNFLARRVPPLEHRELERGIKLANQELLSHGITSLQDASPRNGIDRWRLFTQWKKEGLLQPRIGMMLGIEALDGLQKQGFSGSMSASQLRLGGVKILVHETTGQLSPSQEDLNQMVLKIHQSGLQAALHAVEESTIEASCSAVEFALHRSPRNDHRHRIEHCSVCPPSLAKRLAALGIMVVTQPSFIYYNGDRYLRAVPDGQRSYLYPLATLLKNGVQVASSSDSPIVPINPLIGVYAASSRMAETGEVLSAEEKITALEALRMGTVYAARSNFEEKMKGSIIPGQFADLVVLSEDPTKVPTLEIRDIKVEMTILDGEVVWNKETSR
ncbi:MAG: amidohydrolase family protein, partial [Deltaproteobacteria bacterium]|nr:amidohydrolase family protein [Deltaproteobacteria bacterium]